MELIILKKKYQIKVKIMLRIIKWKYSLRKSSTSKRYNLTQIQVVILFVIESRFAWKDVNPCEKVQFFC